MAALTRQTSGQEYHGGLIELGVLANSPNSV